MTETAARTDFALQWIQALRLLRLTREAVQMETDREVLRTIRRMVRRRLCWRLTMITAAAPSARDDIASRTARERLRLAQEVDDVSAEACVRWLSREAEGVPRAQAIYRGVRSACASHARRAADDCLTMEAARLAALSK